MKKGNSPLWYKDAIIYELQLRSFFDSDADGVGDFPGLIEKLDYLEDLGVNAVWLLPFYPSPLKDDGYDIANYLDVLPAYGTMADFKGFIEAAHRRGIRVITELVINHTSDQHPWFQRARRAPRGSRYRDFYVWSDTPEKYRDARIIFTDTETSNWTWDPVAKQYYWHRFYAHQPDLNFDNPEVRQAIVKVMDYWLKTGVDGLRIDAVPYLYEREGTSCENLPETHAFIKELRRHVNDNFPDRMLLAEANQWPEDAVAYFGAGDEFHMAFNFPLMPRLFLALRKEDRFPIVDIFRQTPLIPRECQWALFLRNHDELTLEMVTDEERDSMYRAYAADPTARLNLGIRRRLAPLLGNDRRKIELMNGLLFSLPGTPVVYYGDEIGMGDNYRLNDRDGVRTPMQWSPQRNAGFSRAGPGQLYLPLVTDPAYQYKVVNVKEQAANLDSLLQWLKRVIALRKRYKTFGRGGMEFLEPENYKVLAYLRQDKGETILVIANLSHLAQQTSLDMARFVGFRPVDLFGRVKFAPITERKYSFTLSPYAFYWFSLEPEEKESLSSKAATAPKVKEVPVLKETAENLFGRKENRHILAAVLLDYIKGRRWFRGKARDARAAEIQDMVPMRVNSATAYVTFLEVKYSEGEAETYVVPLITRPVEKEAGIAEKYPESVIAHLKTPGKNGQSVLCDATVDAGFNRFLLNAIQRRRTFKSEIGEITAAPTRFRSRVTVAAGARLESSPLKVEQTNTSIVYGNQLIFKLYRKLEDGINPDVELSTFLTENTDFSHIPRVVGSMEYRHGKNNPASLGLLQSFVPNEGDAWQYTLNSLASYFKAAALQAAHPTEADIGAYLASARLLGQRTAELHTALTSDKTNSDFAAVPYSLTYQIALYHSLRGSAVQTLELLREHLPSLPEQSQKDARAVLDLEEVIIDRYDLLRREKITASRIRGHGDYHLGQVLFTGKDFVIIDFEGEPARSLTQRRIKHSPLRDVAGMIRSFDYATYTALSRQISRRNKPESAFPLLNRWARYWYAWASAAFLNEYLEKIRPTCLLPENPDHLKILLDAFLLEKAVYEVGYELNNRPDWLNVPLQGILQLLKAEG